MRAIILAAGKGTRFGELTKTIPKSLIPMSGKPIIEYTLEALPSQINEVFLVIGHLGEKIKKHVGKKFKNIKINYIKLKNLTGTASAVFEAKKHVGKNKFLVLYGDDIYSKQELEQLVQFQWAFGLTKSIPPTDKYLSFMLNSKKEITGTRYPTKKEGRTGILISTGAYVADYRLFKYKPVKLSNGEYGLPQTMLLALKKIPIKGVLMKKWIQINNSEDAKKAAILITKTQ